MGPKKSFFFDPAFTFTLKRHYSLLKRIEKMVVCRPSFSGWQLTAR